MSSVVYRAAVIAIASMLVACGGGGDATADPCAPEPGATQALGCAICVHADGSECVPGRAASASAQ
jgi:hypothetical protein